jgi:flavin-dependent dehydrogenase
MADSPPGASGCSAPTAKVGIIGGGPAGLYSAILFKKARPDVDITVGADVHSRGTGMKRVSPRLPRYLGRHVRRIRTTVGPQEPR